MAPKNKGKENGKQEKLKNKRRLKSVDANRLMTRFNTSIILLTIKQTKAKAQSLTEEKKREKKKDRDKSKLRRKDMEENKEKSERERDDGAFDKVRPAT